MKISRELSVKVEADLGLNLQFVKGQRIPVRNCWHFSTDGNAVDMMFYDAEDFRCGMNRIYTVLYRYPVIILAFSLMDTHLHFILYGELSSCEQFVREYVRRTSMHINFRHKDIKKLVDIPIHHQVIDDDLYLKTAICYVVKNAPVGGLNYNAYDYPWSSGALYFRKEGIWTSPSWTFAGRTVDADTLSVREYRERLNTKESIRENIVLIDGIVFPGEYVAYEVVEKIFRTCKSYNFFLCRSKEDDIESRGAILSRASIPMQEMRQNRISLCQELFGDGCLKKLSASQRLKLARVLKARYGSSSRQIARLCGLVYKEVADFF